MGQDTRAALVATTVGHCFANATLADTIIDRVRAATERFADVTAVVAEG